MGHYSVPMNQNFELIRDFLVAKDEHCEVHEAICRCRIAVNLENLSVLLNACTVDNGAVVAVVVPLPINTPPAQRPDVAEFITRVNYHMKIGCFDMDYSDGEIRFRISAALGEAHLTHDMLSHWMLLALTTVDGFFPALLQLIAGTLRPDQAVEQGEGFLRDLIHRKERTSDE